jgi:hypothetical protein
MSYDCYCDYDPPDFCHIEIRRARKPHKCDECGGMIIPNEPYEYTRAKWEGCIDNFKICERCYDIRVWTKNNVPCLCWAYGNIIEDCKSAIDEATWRASEETRGLRFGLLRRIVARDKLNRTRRMGHERAFAGTAPDSVN